MLNRENGRRWSTLLLLGWAAGCGASVSSAPDTRDAGGGDVTDAAPLSLVLDPRTNPLGRSYGEWGTEWYRWTYEIPGSAHPLIDETGANCGQHQTRAVFFLAGNFGGVTRRRCTVPRSKPLFMPIFNSNLDNCGVPTSQQVADAELRTNTRAGIDEVTAMSFALDGATLANTVASFAPYRGGLQQFQYEVPMGDSLFRTLMVDFSGTCTTSFQDGFWIMLAPLPPGQHTIRFTSAAPGVMMPDFMLDVTYQLTVM